MFAIAMETVLHFFYSPKKLTIKNYLMHIGSTMRMCCCC